MFRNRRITSVDDLRALYSKRVIRKMVHARRRAISRIYPGFWMVKEKQNLMLLLVIFLVAMAVVTVLSLLIGQGPNLLIAVAIGALIPAALVVWVADQRYKLAHLDILDALRYPPPTVAENPAFEAVIETLLTPREQEAARALIRGEYQLSTQELLETAKALS